MAEAVVGEEMPKEQHDAETKSDPLLKELNEIRRRRTDGDKRSVFTKKENPVLLMGIAYGICLLYTSPSPRDLSTSRMPSSA